MVSSPESIDTCDKNVSHSPVTHIILDQDMFFGNVTEYHPQNSDEYGLEGAYGPRARKMVTERVPYTEEWYYQLVSCPAQGLRDWLLTDFGCTELQKHGLPCYNETSARPDCKTSCWPSSLLVVLLVWRVGRSVFLQMF